MNKAKDQSVKDGKTYLKERFIDVENAFITSLKMERGADTHDTALGDAVEDAWIELLEKYLPKRYLVAKAFAVDHLGHTTDQLDSLIFDAHFTPALYGKKNNLYVPAEAVYATLEIKQFITTPLLKAAAAKVASLRALQRTSAPVENHWGNSGPKPLFPIIGGMLGMTASWSDGLGEAFLTQFNDFKGDEKLDLVLTAESGFCDHFQSEKEPDLKSGPGSLVWGLFRLLTALRSKATVPAIEWAKYEEVFE